MEQSRNILGTGGATLLSHIPNTFACSCCLPLAIMITLNLDPEKAAGVTGKGCGAPSLSPEESLKSIYALPKRIWTALLLSAACLILSSYSIPSLTSPYFGVTRSTFEEKDVYSKHNFYHTLSRVPSHICPSVVPGTPSYSGYIGMPRDSEESPRRTFFW